MNNRLNLFWQWIKLFHQTDKQNGLVLFYDKKTSLLHSQLLQEKWCYEHAQNQKSNYEISCLICGKFANTIKCNSNNCRYCLLNNLYVENNVALTEANKKYQELLVQRKDAWKKLINFRGNVQ